MNKKTFYVKQPKKRLLIDLQTNINIELFDQTLHNNNWASSMIVFYKFRFTS